MFKIYNSKLAIYTKLNKNYLLLFGSGFDSHSLRIVGSAVVSCPQFRFSQSADNALQITVPGLSVQLVYRQQMGDVCLLRYHHSLPVVLPRVTLLLQVVLLRSCRLWWG